MRLLLDTASFIWAARIPERLTPQALEVIESPDAKRIISALSISEIAIKHAKGTLIFSREDVLTAIADLGLQVLAYQDDHAFRMFGLPLHHKDPFDRQIIAQALAEDLPVVTADRSFSLYDGLKVIW